MYLIMVISFFIHSSNNAAFSKDMSKDFVIIGLCFSGSLDQSVMGVERASVRSI